MPTSPRRLTVVSARQTPRRLALSTVLVMGATLASTSLGFVREIVNAREFGASWELDAFLAAAVVPTILFGVFNGALVSALVPIFSSYLADGREDDAWGLASTLILTLTVGLSVCAALGAFLAPVYVPLIARFPADRLPAAIEMTRWLMPTIVATSLAGVISSLLNAYHRFGSAALQGAVANVATVAIVFFGAPHLGVRALVIGTLLGLFAQLVVQLPAFLSLRRFRVAIDLRHPGLRRLLHVLGPIAIGSAAGQFALFFDRFFASGLGEGTIAGMNYATKLVGFPQQIFVTAIATVVFPLLAAQHAARNRGALRRSLETALRIVMFLTLPSAVGLCMLAGPIVAALFERGAFTPEDTVLCAGLLPYAAVGLVALAANVVLTRALFASDRTRDAIAIAVGTVVLNVALSLLWLPSLGARGLLLANAVSQTLQTFALAVVAWRLLGGLDVRGLAISFSKVASCSAVMGVSLAVVQVFRQPPSATLLSRSTSLTEHLLFGAAVFVGLARLVDSDELHLAIDVVIKRRTRELVPLP